jgi:hypothetical protein
VEALLAHVESAARNDEVPDEDRVARLRAAHRDVAEALAAELG